MELSNSQLQALKQAGFSQGEIEQYAPQLGYQAPKSLSGFGKNLVKSTGNLIGNTASGVLNIANPNLDQNTVFQVFKLANGLIDSLIPGEQGSEKYAQGLADYFVNRYGSLDNIANTFYNDPAGLVDDAAMFLTTGGSAVSKLGKVGKIGEVAQIGSDIAKWGNRIDPILGSAKAVGKVGEMAGGLTGNLTKKIAPNLSKIAEDYPKRGYGQPSTIRQFEKDFRPVNQVVEEYGVYGKDAEKFSKKLDQIQSLFDDIASREDRFVSMETLMNKAIDEIEKLKSSDIVDEVKAGKKLEQAFDLFMERNADQINLKQLTEKRRAFDKATKKFTDNNLDKGVNQRMREILQDAIREEAGDITTPSGENITQLGKRLQEGYAFQPIIEKASLRGATSRPFSLGKMATAGVGGVVAGAPGAIAAYGLDSLSKTPVVDRFISKGLKNVAKLKKPQIKLPQIPSSIGKTYDATKGVRLFERIKKSTPSEGMLQNQEQDSKGQLKMPQNQILTGLKKKKNQNPFTRL